MIEFVFYFALGFLVAGFIALLLGPAVWRRAVNLTRRGIEASMPLTLNEIQADKDALRAQHAMATRRLEMEVRALKERAAGQSAEVGRVREEARRAGAERDDRLGALDGAQKARDKLEADMKARETTVAEMQAKLKEALKVQDGLRTEIGRLQGLFDEATYASSARQIELVARESEIEKLTDDLATAARSLKELDGRIATADAERRSTANTIVAEKKRAAGLEARIADLTATIAGLRDERDSHERDASSAKAAHAEAAQALDANTQYVEGEKDAKRQALERRLATLMRENKRLRGALAVFETPASADAPEAAADDKTFRDQIKAIAAEVIHMAIVLEGDDSPVAKALGSRKDARVVDGDGNPVTSIADRVRALRKAAAQSLK